MMLTRARMPPQTAVVSHAFWMRELGGDPAAIGQTIVLNAGRSP